MYHYKGPRRRREREKEAENISEDIIAENFPTLGRETNKIQRAHRVPNKMNPKRFKPRYIINKMSKTKDKVRILKAAIENN